MHPVSTQATLAPEASAGAAADGSPAAPATPQFGLRFAPKEVQVQRCADGSILLRSPIELTGCGDNIVDYFEKWANDEPERVFLAQRAVGGGGEGGWQSLSYARAWQQVQAVAQALLDAGLTAQTPIAILSGASLDHAVLTLAGMLVGIPVAPVSPNYTLLPAARPRLEEIVDLLQPGLVFVEDAARFAAARSLPQLAGARWWCAQAGDSGMQTIASLHATRPGAAVQAAR